MSVTFKFTDDGAELRGLNAQSIGAASAEDIQSINTAISSISSQIMNLNNSLIDLQEQIGQGSLPSIAGDGIYTQLIGNVLGLIPGSAALILRQIGMLPLQKFLLGDGGRGGTLEYVEGTSQVRFVVDYMAAVHEDYPALSEIFGTNDYYMRSAIHIYQYVPEGIVIGSINQQKVAVTFPFYQNPNEVNLFLGGYVPRIV
jgi:hypothetical protein